MERQEFLHLFGIGATLLLTGCLGSCATARLPASSSAAAREPAATLTPAGSAAVADPATEPALDLCLDLRDPAHAALHDPRRGYIYLAEGRVIVAKTLTDTYLVVAATCPHLGEQLRYERRDDQFACPAHGSRFKFDGSLLEGPSGRGLRPYQARRAGHLLYITG